MPRPSDQLRIYDSVAPRYHAEVVTPFAKGVDFRLGSDVRRILREWRDRDTIWRRVVIDFGCGIGEGLALVAGKVGLAAGIDFSNGMLSESLSRLERLGLETRQLRGSLRVLARFVHQRWDLETGTPTTVLARGNLLRLNALTETCDLALAINSIGPPSVGQAYRMFQQVVQCVRRRGTMIAVLPSLDTMYHLSALERRHRVSASEREAIDPVTGIYTDMYGEREKFFAPDEIRQLARDNGLRVTRLEKIRYPWTLMRRFGWGYYPRSPRIWDWYLVADKR